MLLIMMFNIRLAPQVINIRHKKIQYSHRSQKSCSYGTQPNKVSHRILHKSSNMERLRAFPTHTPIDCQYLRILDSGCIALWLIMHFTLMQCSPDHV